MYGMVNRAIMDLVITTDGPEAWERVCRRAGMTAQVPSNTTVYDDAITYDLVGAAAEELGLEPATVLEQFGRHWILFTGREGWGPLFDIAGDTMASFIDGLDALHARVQASMPECRMPSFSAGWDPDGSLLIEYRSDRDGLAPMVLGILGGLAESFGEQWEIEHIGRRGDVDAELFSLRPISIDDEVSRSVGAV